jgi:ubiquinone/menaquinone biosynthesis C-methylase UbiE
MNPILTRDEAAYFERLAEVEAAHWWSRGMWRLASHWLKSALRGKLGLRALDVGCGTGMNLARLATQPEIDEVVGLDFSRKALARARRHSQNRIRGSALSLPFEDRCFDVVTAFDVLQHLPDRTDTHAAREIRRVLRAGGYALVRANSTNTLSQSAFAGTHYRLRELTSLLEKAGLAVIRASYANCIPALAQEIADRWRERGSNAIKAPESRAGLRIQIPAPWANRLLGGVSAAEAFLAGPLRSPLPYGHSTLVLARRPVRAGEHRASGENSTVH